MLIECILIVARLLPVLVVILVPVRHYLPYSLDANESLEGQEAVVTIGRGQEGVTSEEENYLSGELTWHNYTGDIALTNQRIEQCRRNIRNPQISRTRFVGCVLQLSKLRIKFAASTAAKAVVGRFGGIEEFILYAVSFLLSLCLLVAVFYANIVVPRHLRTSMRRHPPYIGMNVTPAVPHPSDSATAKDNQQSSNAKTKTTPVNYHDNEHQLSSSKMTSSSSSSSSSSLVKLKKRVCFQVDPQLGCRSGSDVGQGNDPDSFHQR